MLIKKELIFGYLKFLEKIDTKIKIHCCLFKTSTRLFLHFYDYFRSLNFDKLYLEMQIFKNKAI